MRHDVKQGTFLAAMLAAFTCVATTRPARAQDAQGAAQAPLLVQVRGGTVSFKVDTNVPAVNVHGKSKALAGRVYVRDGATGAVLEKLEASVPVESLETGLGLRDDHMRKRVFATPDGRLPDLKFSSGGGRCSPKAGRQTTCQLSGTLSLRDVERPFSIALKVDDDGGELHASGDGLVKLSTYGIERPSNLGVQTSDEVALHLEFEAARPASAHAGGRH